MPIIIGGGGGGGGSCVGLNIHAIFVKMFLSSLYKDVYRAGRVGGSFGTVGFTPFLTAKLH